MSPWNEAISYSCVVIFFSPKFPIIGQLNESLFYEYNYLCHYTLMLYWCQLYVAFIPSSFVCLSTCVHVHVVVCLHVFCTCCSIQLTYVKFLFSSTHLQSECQKILQDLAKIAILADLTLILAWRWVLLLGT